MDNSDWTSNQARLVALAFFLFLPIISISFLGYLDGYNWFASAITAEISYFLFILFSLSAIQSSWLRKIWVASLLLVLMIFQILRMVSFFVQGDSFNDSFFFHLSLSSLLDTGTAFIPMFCILLSFLLLIIFLALKSLQSFRLKKSLNKILLTPIFLIGCFTIDPDLTKATVFIYEKYSKADSIHYVNHFTQFNQKDWDRLGLNPSAFELSSDIKSHPGKNLVIIYMESIEQAFTDDVLFPELTPNLTRISNMGLALENIIQMPGSGWTIAGIASSQCGTPLLHNSTLSNGNDLLQNGLISRARCLGDILDAAGYQQTYMGGAPTQFAGKQEFLKAHGYDDISGMYELKGQIDNTSDMDGWGIYDDALFNLAYNKFSQLADSGAPFNLTVLTLDSHMPGRPSPSCPDYKAVDGIDLDAVYCTDFLVGQFVDKLRRHPAWNNTVLVLMSDHLAFKPVAKNYFPKKYPRRLFSVIVDGEAENAGRTINKLGSHLDIAPTILDSLGVSHSVSFLGGRSLLDKTEDYSVDKIMNEERITALRQINAEMLSGSWNICSSDPVFMINEETINLGGSPVTLSQNGWPIELSKLGQEISLLTKIDSSGRVLTNSVVNSNDLSKAIHNALLEQAFVSDEGGFLVIAPTTSFSHRLTKALATDKPMSATLLDNTGELLASHSVDRLEELRIILPNCNDAWAQSQIDAQLRSASKLLPDSCLSSEMPSQSYSNQTGSLTIDRVTVGDQQFSARLLEIDKGVFRVEDYAALNEVGTSGYQCSPSLDGEFLIIPKVAKEQADRFWVLQQTGNSTQSQLTFRLIKEFDFEEVRDKAG